MFAELTAMLEDRSSVELDEFAKFESALRNISTRTFALAASSQDLGVVGHAENVAQLWQLLCSVWDAAGQRCFGDKLMSALALCKGFELSDGSATVLAKRPERVEVEVIQQSLAGASTFVDMATSVFYKTARESKVQITEDVHVIAQAFYRIGTAIVQLEQFADVSSGGGMLPLHVVTAAWVMDSGESVVVPCGVCVCARMGWASWLLLLSDVHVAGGAGAPESAADSQKVLEALQALMRTKTSLREGAQCASIAGALRKHCSPELLQPAADALENFSKSVLAGYTEPCA